MSIINGQGGDGGAGSSNNGSGDGAGSGSQNGGVTDWRTSLPEDIRSEKVFESIKGKDWGEVGPSIAKQLVHAQRMVGGDKLTLLTDKSTPEERAAFYTKLGRPEKPDGYQYKLPEGMREDGINKERITKWQTKMHELGLSKTAADTLLSEFIAEEFGHGKAHEESEAKKIEAWELGLKQELGAKYEEKTNIAVWAAKEFGSPELLDILDKTGLGSHPDVVKMFVKIGEQMSDDHARNGGSGNGPQNFSAMNPAQAQAALNEFNRNESNMKILFDKGHTEHDKLVKERAELFAAAFPKLETR